MRILPEITPENRSFWEGGARGELMISLCDDCHATVHPPKLICPHCLSRNVVPRASSGTGTVYTWTINHQAWLPGMVVPFALAVVDVDGVDGARVTAEVFGCEPEDVHIGQRMRILFEPVGDIWFPQWTPLHVGARP